MTGFEPRTSGIASDLSTNWATTTAQVVALFTERKTENMFCWQDNSNYNRFSTALATWLYPFTQMSVYVTSVQRQMEP